MTLEPDTQGDDPNTRGDVPFRCPSGPNLQWAPVQGQRMSRSTWDRVGPTGSSVDCTNKDCKEKTHLLTKENCKFVPIS
jgi:hypothetical protein